MINLKNLNRINNSNMHEHRELHTVEHKERLHGVAP